MSLSMRPNNKICVIQLYQKEGDNMQEKLKKVTDKKILELTYSWGLNQPGIMKTIITNDKKLYYYHYYHHLTPFLKENNIPQESISKGLKLSSEEYLEILNFIEKEIINKKYKSLQIRDVCYRVSVKYHNREYIYVNCYDSNNNEKIYEKAQKLIKEIESRKINEKK